MFCPRCWPYKPLTGGYSAPLRKSIPVVGDAALGTASWQRAAVQLRVGAPEGLVKDLRGGRARVGVKEEDGDVGALPSKKAGVYSNSRASLCHSTFQGQRVCSPGRVPFGSPRIAKLPQLVMH